MSFSSRVKNELCKNELSKCCETARLYGILLFCGRLSPRGIQIKTENAALIFHAKRLLQKICGVTPQTYGTPGSGRLRLFICAPGDILKIDNALDMRLDAPSRRIRYGLLEKECCRASFLGGVFLSCGSVSDPERSYHLEFETPFYNLSNDLYALLADFGLSPKSSSRKSGRVIYFKESEQIEDILSVMGAAGSAFALMDAKIVKDLRNNINRLTNCETANIGKMVEASGAQLESIRRIIKHKLTLPEDLKKTAELRLKNPDLSLAEIGKLLDPPLTKSGVSHRLRKIMEIAGNER